MERPVEQNQESRNKPHRYSSLIFDKGAKKLNVEKKVSSINGAKKAV